jgi:hypothetical protein
MANGHWEAMRPSMGDKFWGFRISQLMVPFMEHSDVLKKMEDPNRPRRMFFNEVLGLHYDEGELVMTENDIKCACENRNSDTINTAWRWQADTCVGIDHGMGAYSAVDPLSGTIRQSRSRSGRQPSYTVMAFGGFCPDGIFRIFNILKFTGEMANLANQPALIDDIARKWGVRWAMSDHGFGAQTNQSLITKYNWVRLEDGINPLLMECNYVSSINPVSFNPVAMRYLVDRNFAIEEAVDGIKHGKIKFFKWEEMQAYVDDFTSLYVEYLSALNRLKYDHVLPDDCFHAVVYCYMAARQMRGQLVPGLMPNI